MYKLLATAVVLGGGLYLSACATLNESECQTVDWKQLGDSDGAQGHGQTRIAQPLSLVVQKVVLLEFKTTSTRECR